MNTHRFFVTSALFFGIITTAHAVSLGGGPLAVNQGTVPAVAAWCNFANQGAVPITIVLDQLYDQAGNPLSDPALDTCPATLNPADSCRIATTTLAPTITAVHCKFVYTGVGATASGVIEAHDVDDNSLSTGDLRTLP